MNPILQQLADKFREYLRNAGEFDLIESLFKKLDKEITILEFKLDRTEKVKRTTSVLLEETIDELEQKRKEAIKQTSLDRIRGQIASMRSTEDLQRITPIIWHELTVLGVPFIRCGVFIIDEQKQIVQVYLSAPDGHSLAAMNLPFKSNDLTSNSVKSWREGAVYKEHWNKEQFVNWMQSLIDQGHIQDTQTYQGASRPPESLYLHFVPFTQGMLYVGNVESISEEKLDLVKALAETFAIAYARYEDFNNLDKAKQSIESTLTELKATQSQLIQSEKMASLGELTAGIAHEIQNPLNFVNNFSEVNGELIEEMKEAIKKGDADEAIAIAQNIAENEEKINHHGKRADAIVKSMLLHSRSGQGTKELIDINKMLDEYLRLAYHGMRAKDKSFNVKMESVLSDDAGEIEINAQEMGRVVLNILTNAFHALRDKLDSNEHDHFTPTLTVTSQRSKKEVVISIQDNGGGIPPELKDKIFQPFFTTKATGQGTGLGLSLSYDIVKAHGGKLTVNSSDGKGSEFKIILPTQSNNET